MPSFLSGLTGLRVCMNYDSCQLLTMSPKYFNFDPLSTCLPVWQANQKVRFRFHLFSSFEEAKIKLKGSEDRNFWSCSWRKQSILETSEKNKVPIRKKSTSKTVLFCFPSQTVVMWFVYDTKCLDNKTQCYGSGSFWSPLRDNIWRLKFRQKSPISNKQK